MKPSEITIILAPLQGFTDVIFRNIFSKHFKGVDEAMAPFISTMGQQRLKPSRIKDVFPEKNTNIPIVPQILGNVAQDFIFLANHLADMGHTRINWNLGCPHSKIAKKKRGSGLLMYPEMLDTLLGEILPCISGTLSLKLRLGRKEKEEIKALLPIFDHYDIEEIILHPRTGVQMYEGSCDHEAFIKAERNSRHYFTYNGDIVDIASYNNIKKKIAHIDRFMIGRGLLANPFLAEQIKGIPCPADPLPRLKVFLDDLFESYKTVFHGPAHLTGRMKGFWSYLGPSFKNNKKHLKKILKSRSIEQYKDMTDSFFQQNLEFLFKK